MDIETVQSEIIDYAMHNCIHGYSRKLWKLYSLYNACRLYIADNVHEYHISVYIMR